MNNINIRGFIKFALGWPISIISLYFIFKLINPNWEIIGSYFSKANYFALTLGFFCFITYFFLRGYVWQLILKAKDYNLSFREVLYLWELSEFKRYVPGNVWSFIGRGLSFTGKKVKRDDVVHSLAMEAELIIISSITMSLLSMQFLIGPLQIPFKDYIYATLFFLVLCINLLFVYSYLFKSKIKNRFASYLLNGFSVTKNIELLFTSLLSFLFFGLGSFFVAFAFFNLNLSMIFVLTGFFCLALIAGYLSFITPMGLGVREGVIVYGLSHIVSLSIAGSASILTRIFLIGSEIIFLLLTLIIYSIKAARIEKFYELLTKYKTGLILAFLAVLYNAYFISASILRYEKYFAGRFDLGNMDQVVWNTMRGRIFQLTDPNGIDITSRLAFHADFILVLLAPLYYIWSDPRLLLIIQTIVLSLGSVFVFLIAKEIVKNKPLSLLFSFIYLINPAVNYTNLYDFHPVTLGTTLLLGAFYFLIKKRYLWFILFAILAGTTKEHVWLIVGLFGLYTFIKAVINKDKNHSKFIGILFFLAGLLIFYILIWYAIPTARGGNHFALTYYSEFGDSPSSVIKNMIFSPVGTLQRAFQPSQNLYLMQLFLPLGFLSLFSPLMLVFALPDFGINLLSNNSQLHQIYYQYSSTITPFLFISAIYSAKLFVQKLPKFSKILFAYLVIISIYGAYLYGPLPGAKTPSIDMFTKNLVDKNIIDDFIANIPKQYSIAATNNIGSHLSHRQKIFTIPVGIDSADIIVFLLNDPSAQPSLAAQIKMAKQMENNKNYVQIFKSGNFVVFEKRNLYLKQSPKINQAKLFPFSIPALINREYQPSRINIEKNVTANGLFDSFIASYDSDGLKIFTLLNIPKTTKPQDGFPILILNHGYINPTEYDTINSYNVIADYYSSSGFIVIKPDYRGNGSSEIDNKPLMRFAYPIDVLNLLASIGSIEDADTNNVYFWGHSMGGEITLKILEIAAKNKILNAKIKAAVIWAPVSDTIKWFGSSNLPKLPESRLRPFPYSQTFKLMGTPSNRSEIWQSVSPLSYLQNISTPVLIQHGTSDNSVPYTWSVELYNDLISLNKNSRLILYQNDDHNLSVNRNRVFIDSLSFLKSH